MSNLDPIYVTKPHLPPLEDFIPLLQQIWERRILTNNGPFHQELEDALCKYLGVKHLSLFSNGTIALVTALKALGVSGEVITTPYSFVATAHSLLWNNITPVFVDIDPVTFNLDPSKIEAAITDKTTAILPVHCYGFPCDVDAIQEIADRNGLKVIYDAAHAFGVNCHCGSVLNHGDLSILSFHATKVFNTFEGGAIICHDKDTKQKIDKLKNFGFVGETEVEATGINGKMNELQAAIGLLQLQSIDVAIDQRSVISSTYREQIEKIEGLSCPPPSSALHYNEAYFPILVKPEYRLSRDGLYEKLRQANIYARRYFYPLITDFSMYRHLFSSSPEKLPIANLVASQVICLPIYSTLSTEDLDRVLAILAY
ncbi:Predicted pyridoxal phosphate-dependent enzyme apparently involved in regulation of cell wall biogenesis [Synechococcus sp. RCC307]|nr:Predicted pyridoxal phosphate-dependent enzyme apparently involved in regulation of cell wall biogenesis [Synechococcus sp. RCC307]